MGRKKILLGFAGVIGIWLTAGLALPFVNVFKYVFTVPQLMVFRGFLTAVMALVVLRGTVGKVDQWTYAIAFVLPFATLGLFEGIRNWGAAPTITLITATPLVNFAVSRWLGRSISRASIVGLVLMLGGVGLALQGGTFDPIGFSWALFGTIANGLLYECFARATAKSLQKCFYACIGMGVLGLCLSWNDSWEGVHNPDMLRLVLGFALVGGFLYWIANLLAFENLPTTEASILAQGETPAVIIGAYFLLGERFTATQWMGVFIALFGAWYLSRWLAKQSASHEKIASE